MHSTWKLIRRMNKMTKKSLFPNKNLALKFKKCIIVIKYMHIHVQEFFYDAYTLQLTFNRIV